MDYGFRFSYRDKVGVLTLEVEAVDTAKLEGYVYVSGVKIPKLNDGAIADPIREKIITQMHLAYDDVEGFFVPNVNVVRIDVLKEPPKVEEPSSILVQDTSIIQ